MLIPSMSESLASLEMDVEPGGELVIFVVQAVDRVPPFVVGF